MAFIHSPKIITDGLILALDAANSKSYVSGSTTWNNLVNSTISGSLVNGPTFNTGSGGNIVFDGVDDYVDTPYITPISTSDFTFATWLKFTTSQLSSVITKRVGAPTYEQLSIYIAGDANANTPGTKVVVNDVKSIPLNRVLISTNSYNDGLWHYIVATRTSTSTNLYIDGSFITSASSSIIDLSTSSKLFIGRGGDNQTVIGNAYNGSIGITQLYNKLLSPQEVLQNYNATKGRFGL